MELDQRSKTSDILSIYVPAFFIFLGMGIVSPILAIYARSFQVSFAFVSLAISMYAIGRLIADIPVGMLSDRIGRRPVMILGTVILATMSFFNANATNFWMFVFFRFLQGVGSAMWINARQTLLADILRPEERGRILGYFQSFQLIGSAAGPTVGGFVAAFWDIRAPFYFYSLLGVISLIFTIILVHDPKSVRERGRESIHFSPQVMWRILHIRSFTMACLASFSITFLTAGVRDMIIPLYADNVIGLGEAQIGTVLSYTTFLNLLMTIPIGYMIDYYGRKSVILKSLYVTAAASFLFSFTYDYWSISLVAVVLGVGTSGSQQAPLAMATDVTINEPRGLSIGIYRIFADIGFVIGPVILGFIADNFGLRASFYFMSALLFINAALMLAYAKETFSARKRKRDGNGAAE